MMSTCAAIFATTAGWRYVFPSTMVPTRMRGTRAASAASVLHDSSMAPSRSFVLGMSWPVTQAMSHLVASRCRQRSSTPDQVWAPMLVKRPKRMSVSFLVSIPPVILSQLGSSFPPLWHILHSEPRENRDAFRNQPPLRGTTWARARSAEPRGRRPADRSGGLREHLGAPPPQPRGPSRGSAHCAFRRGPPAPPRPAGDGAAAGEWEGGGGPGARSGGRLRREGIAGFRDGGGRRAGLHSGGAGWSAGPPSPDGPDDPCDLRCSRDQARERLHRLRALGFDDIVLVTGNHDAAQLQELHELTVSSR